MGKIKFASVEEAKENLLTSKEELQVSKDELKSYRKENKLEKDTDYSEDAKHGKTWKKLVKAIDSKTESITEIKTWLEDNKPKKEKVVRESKYEYPAECSSEADRKKFRAAQRRKANSGEKEETQEKPKKDKAEKEEKVASGKTRKDKKSKED